MPAAASFYKVVVRCALASHGIVRDPPSCAAPVPLTRRSGCLCQRALPCSAEFGRSRPNAAQVWDLCVARSHHIRSNAGLISLMGIPRANTRIRPILGVWRNSWSLGLPNLANPDNPLNSGSLGAQSRTWSWMGEAPHFLRRPRRSRGWLSAMMLWLSGTTASISGGSDDMARAHHVTSELGRVGAFLEVSFVLCAH